MAPRSGSAEESRCRFAFRYVRVMCPNRGHYEPLLGDLRYGCWHDRTPIHDCREPLLVTHWPTSATGQRHAAPPCAEGARATRRPPSRLDARASTRSGGLGCGGVAETTSARRSFWVPCTARRSRMPRLKARPESPATYLLHDQLLPAPMTGSVGAGGVRSRASDDAIGVRHLRDRVWCAGPS